MKAKEKKYVILILGASGMLGNAIYRYLIKNKVFKVYGTIRSESFLRFFPSNLKENLFTNIDINYLNDLEKLVNDLDPNLIINCIGIIKQKEKIIKLADYIYLNSLIPHKLAELAFKVNAKLLHFSTDCVFSGKKGFYKETDFADADDIYGRSKFIGELNYPNTITLRTSIIGHELNSSLSLIDWFLSQEHSIKGYNKAIFSGLPTVEIARIIENYIIPANDLYGLYHLSAEPISKYSLLNIVSKIYKKNIIIEKDEEFIVDKSLNSSKFRKETTFFPKQWDQLIKEMKDFN